MGWAQFMNYKPAIMKICKTENIPRNKFFLQFVPNPCAQTIFVLKNVITSLVRSFQLLGEVVPHQIIKIQIYANSIKFDDCFGDQDTPGHTETKLISIKQLDILHLQVVIAVHRRVQTFYRQKTTKITPRNQFFAICAQPMCPNYFVVPTDEIS